MRAEESLVLFLSLIGLFLSVVVTSLVLFLASHLPQTILSFVISRKDSGGMNSHHIPIIKTIRKTHFDIFVRDRDELKSCMLDLAVIQENQSRQLSQIQDLLCRGIQPEPALDHNRINSEEVNQNRKRSWAQMMDAAEVDSQQQEKLNQMERKVAQQEEEIQALQASLEQVQLELKQNKKPRSILSGVVGGLTAIGALLLLE